MAVSELNRQVGYMTQKDTLLPWRTAADNIRIALELKCRAVPRAEAAARVAQMIDLVGLTGFERHYPAELSGGMRKRVGLARSIVLDPKMILYDEPTTGLDPITAAKINDLIIDLQSKLNVTSVVVTHDIQSAFSVGDRIAFLNQGVFEWVGTMDEARDSDHPVLREFLRSSAVSAAQPTR
jgi:ABC-type transporter Mla maintaining outer membrane lipid asymmetry ATPase subunit MlaF